MTTKHLLFSITFAVLLATIAACAESTPSPFPGFTPIHQPTTLSTTPVAIPATNIGMLTQTVVPAKTLSPALTPTPDFCNATEWQGEIRVLSEILFTALEPGGPVEFDRILAEQNPDWGTFQQEVKGEGLWTAGEIFASFAWGYELGTGVNPAVILTTYGVKRHWEIPPDGDLITEVDQIRATLYEHDLEWSLGKADRSEYPPLANASTYALYRYFDGDIKKLDEWCHTYVQVFGISPLKASDK